MDDLEQEKINEECYETGYLKKPKSTEIITEDEVFDCASCLFPVTKKDDYTAVMIYSINADNTGETNHMEFFHKRCWKTIYKRMHGV